MIKLSTQQELQNLIDSAKFHIDSITGELASLQAQQSYYSKELQNKQPGGSQFESILTTRNETSRIGAALGDISRSAGVLQQQLTKYIAQKTEAENKLSNLLQAPQAQPLPVIESKANSNPVPLLALLGIAILAGVVLR